MRKFSPLLPPSFIFASDPLLTLYVVPKVHAHLSAFSWPRRSYQAFRLGSVTDSSSSWLMMDAIPSAPGLLFGEEVVCSSHADGQRSGFPMNAYLMFVPLIVPYVCQPQ